MDAAFPVEEPELHTQSLSPVSPKPAHLPSPSNIPILEQQLDPSFNDQINESNPSFAPQTKDSQMQVDGVDYTSQVASHDEHQSISTTTDAHSLELSHSTIPDTKPLKAIPSLSARDIGHHTSEPDAQASQSHSTAIPASTSSPNHATSADAYRSHTSPTSYDDAQNASNNDPYMEGAGIDLDALLNDLSASSSFKPKAPADNDATAKPDTVGSHANVSALPSAAATPMFAGVANLPPRPPPQENTSTYLPGDGYQGYEHQTQNQASANQKYALPPGMSFVAPVLPPLPMSTAGAPGTSVAANGLPPPPLATFQQAPPSSTSQNGQNSSTTSAQQREERRPSIDSTRDGDEDEPWPAELEKHYEEFLNAERGYVSEGRWDQFPLSSRLFIGNIPAEKVTKRDLFHVFHKHGKLAQISIKQAYGFVQFLDAASCGRALHTEQGIVVRGRKIHLEISKPQKNTNKNAGANNDGRASRNRRSRSPDYTRGGTGGNNGNNRGADRYRGTGNSNGTNSNNNNNNRQQQRKGDLYQPGRSPSPRRGSRDEYRTRDRSAERYNGRRRSRSRSPRRGGGRMRSPSPRRDDDIEDDLPLPRRDPRDVPDIQIIAKDEPDRAFISYVERTFTARDIRCNVLMLSPRLSEAAVIRRQIIEGVLAVLKINRITQATQKYHLHVFDRAAGNNAVAYAEYENQDLNICVELVAREKVKAAARATAAAPQSSAYNNPYGLPPAPAPLQQQHHPLTSFIPPVPPPPQSKAQGNGNLSNAISALDSATLQQLLGAMQPPQHSPANAAARSLPGNVNSNGNSTTDLARLLASATTTQGSNNASNQSNNNTNSTANAAYASLANNPAFAGLFNGILGQQGGAGGVGGQQQRQGQAQSQAQGQQGSSGAGGQDMSAIMAQLAKYGR